MAVQNYTGWATGVNRIILDSTSFTFGENALKNDELENGLKRSKKRSAFCPDKFSVKMAFNWVDEVILHTYDAQGNILTDIPTGKTEFQLFTEWYKYQHKYGSVPFEFPRILYSQNTGILIYDEVNGNDTVEYYKITSAVSGNKSGDCIEITMDWEAVYGGVVSVDSVSPAVVGMTATTTYMDIYFSEVADTAPVAQMFSLFFDDVLTPKTGFCFDGSKTARIYYSEIESGTTVTFSLDNYAGLSIAKDTYVAEV